jgi:hypothetical protein
MIGDAFSVVAEGPPDGVIAVDNDGILDLHRLHGPPNVRHAVFEWKLGRVRANHDESVPVFL